MSDCLLLQILQGHFSELRQRLMACELDDFGFDQDTDWSVHSSQVLCNPSM